MKRFASALWRGALKEGRGTLTTQSGVLAGTPYFYSTRFEDERGTNPEELIGAAHAGCFCMALSARLGEAGFQPDWIETKATVTLAKVEDGFAITEVHLDVSASVPEADEAQFFEIARQARQSCPVSRLLTARITLDAWLSTGAVAHSVAD